MLKRASLYTVLACTACCSAAFAIQPTIRAGSLSINSGIKPSTVSLTPVTTKSSSSSSGVSTTNSRVAISAPLQKKTSKYPVTANTSTTASETAAALDALRDRIAELTAQQDEMADSLVETVQSHIDELDFTKNTSLKNTLTGLTSDVSNLTNDLADVNSDVTTLNSAVTGITGDISTLATTDQLDAVSRDLSTVTSSVAALTPEKIASDIANSSNARATLSDKMLKNSSGQMLFATKSEIEANALADKLNTVFATKDLSNVNTLTNNAIRSAVINTLEEKEILDSSGELAITGTIDETVLSDRLSNYPTKTEVENAYATKSAVTTGALKTALQGEFAAKSDVQTAALKEALKGEFAAKSLESTVATLQTGGDVDLTGYVKTEDLADYATKDLSNVTNNTKIVNTVIDTLKGKNILDNSGELAIGGIDDTELAGKLKDYAKTADIAEAYAAKSDVNGLQDQIDILNASGGAGGGSVDLKEYAKKSEIESEYAPLSSLATANESISSLRADLAKATGGIETKDSILNKIANDDDLKGLLKGADGERGADGTPGDYYEPEYDDKTGELRFKKSDGTYLDKRWNIKGAQGESGKAFNLQGTIDSYAELSGKTCDSAHESYAWYNLNADDVTVAGKNTSNLLFVCSNKDGSYSWVGVPFGQKGDPGRNAKTVEQSYCESNYTKVKALFSERAWSNPADAETDCANTSLFSYADYSAVTGGAGAYCMYLAEQIGNGRMTFESGSVGKKISTMFGTSVNKNKTLEQLSSRGVEDVLSATFTVNNVNIKFMQACEAKYNEIMNPKTVEQTYCEANFAKVHALYPSKVQTSADCADATKFTPADYTAMIGGATAYCLHIAETAGNMNLNDGIGKKLSGIFSTEAMTAFRNANTLESRLAVREFKVSKDATEKVTFMTACEARYNEIMNPETPWHAYCVSQAEGYPEGTTNETAIIQPLFNKNCDTFTNDDWNAIQGGAKAYCLYIATQIKKNAGTFRKTDVGERLDRVLPNAITAVSQNGLSARVSINGTSTPFMDACEAKYNEIMNPETPWFSYCTAQNDIFSERTNLEVIITPLFPSITKCEDFTSEDYNAINGGAKAYCTYIAKQAKNDTSGTFEASDTGKTLKRVFGEDVITNLKNATKNDGLSINLKFGSTTTKMNFISACEAKYNEIMNPETTWHAYCESTDENATAVNGVKPKKLTTIIQPLYSSVTDCSKFTSDQYNALQGGATAYCMYISKTLKDYSKSGELATFKQTATGKKLVKVLSESLVNTAASGDAVSKTFMTQCEEKYNEIMAGQNGEDAKSLEQSYCEEHYDVVKQLFTDKNWSTASTITDAIKESDCANLFSIDDYTAVTSGDTAYCLYITKLVKGKTPAEVTTFEATDTGRKLKKLFGGDVLGKLQSSGISATVTINNREMTFLEGCKKKYNEIMAGENAKSVEQSYCEEHYDIVKQLFSDKRWSTASTITDAIKESDCASLFSSDDYAAITAGSRSYCLYLLKNMTASFDLDTGIGKKLAKTFGAEKMETLKGKGTLAARMSVGGFKVDSKNSDGTFMQACEARYDEIMSGEDATPVEMQYCLDNIDKVKMLYSDIKGTDNCDLFTNERYTAVIAGAKPYCLSLLQKMDSNFDLTAGIGKKLAKTFGNDTMTTLRSKGSMSDKLSMTGFTSSDGASTDFMTACESRYNEIMTGEDGEAGEDAVTTWCKKHIIGATGAIELTPSKIARAKNKGATFSTQKLFASLQACKDAVAADPDIMGGESAAEQAFNDEKKTAGLSAITFEALSAKKSGFVNSLKGENGYSCRPEMVSGSNNSKMRFKKYNADGTATSEYCDNQTGGYQIKGADGESGFSCVAEMFDPAGGTNKTHVRYKKMVGSTQNGYCDGNANGFQVKGDKGADGKTFRPAFDATTGTFTFAESSSTDSVPFNLEEALQTKLNLATQGLESSGLGDTTGTSLLDALKTIAADVSYRVSKEVATNVSRKISQDVSETREQLTLQQVPAITSSCDLQEDGFGTEGGTGTCSGGKTIAKVVTVAPQRAVLQANGTTSMQAVTASNFGNYVKALSVSHNEASGAQSGESLRDRLDQLAGITRGTSCDPNNYRNSAGVCVACPEYSTSNGGTVAYCTCSGVLTWQNGSCECSSSNVYGTRANCQAVPANATRSSDGQSFICNAGYYHNGNSCVACVSGSTSTAGSSSCTCNNGGTWTASTNSCGQSPFEACKATANKYWDTSLSSTDKCVSCGNGVRTANIGPFDSCTCANGSPWSTSDKTCQWTQQECIAANDYFWKNGACSSCGNGGHRTGGTQPYDACSCDKQMAWNSSTNKCEEVTALTCEAPMGVYNLDGTDTCVKCMNATDGAIDENGNCYCTNGAEFSCMDGDPNNCKCEKAGSGTEVGTETGEGGEGGEGGEEETCKSNKFDKYGNCCLGILDKNNVCTQCADIELASYDPETDGCKCEDGYTFDTKTKQCVEK